MCPMEFVTFNYRPTFFNSVEEENAYLFDLKLGGELQVFFLGSRGCK